MKILFYTFFLLIFTFEIRPEIIHLYPGMTTLSRVILNAGASDTVIVHKGNYFESNIEIKKPVCIKGEEGVIIDCESRGGGFRINSDSVILMNIEIRNTSYSFLEEISAVRVEKSMHCYFDSITLNNTFFGFYLLNVKKISILNCTISGNAVMETSSGNGIHIWHSSGIQLEKNIITGQRDGIYFEFVKDSFVKGNLSTKNLRYGMHFMFSDSNEFSHNTFRENGAGVAVMYSKHIIMNSNNFECNWGPASYGILLKDISVSKIENNIFSNNTSALYMESSSSVSITRNDFIFNGWAIKIMGNCMQNSIEMNNFVSNTFDVATNSSRSENHFSGNYWDKYEGYDLDKDGTGDVAYRPVSLFSMLVEKVPESIFLLRSFIIDLLDAGEKILPSMIPESLQDNAPSVNIN